MSDTRQQETVKLGRWVNGKVNTRRQTDIGAEALDEATNIDITANGDVRSRDGYALALATSDAHSLWSNGAIALYFDNNSLNKFDAFSNSAESLASGIQATRLRYQELNGEIYITSENWSGIFDGQAVRPWGVPKAMWSPSIAPDAAGGMGAGSYLLAMTLVDENTGEEGPASELQVGEVTVDGGGLYLSALPQTPGYNKVIYMSQLNSDVLYRYAILDAASTTLSISASSTLGMELATQYMDPMPTGQCLAYYNGRMYVAKENVLYFSDPLRFGLYNRRTGFIQFPHRINVLAAVTDGLYVSSGKQLYFLRGAGPTEFSQSIMPIGEAVEGSDMPFPEDKVPQGSMRGSFWFTEDGLVYGLDSGRLEKPQEGKYAPEKFSEGAALYKTKDGLNQIVSAMQKAGEENPMAVGDVATAEIRRNGILI